MPIYEFTCSNCENEFELLMRDGDLPACPGCGGDSLNRLLSLPAAHSTSGGDLPVREPQSAETCGLPQCGMGGCQMQ